MARFERSNKRKGRREFERGPSRNGSRNRSFEVDSRGRGGRSQPDREFRSEGRGGREVSMTRVICSSCGIECEVPFKPTSSKPVYCKDCFSKGDKPQQQSHGQKDFDIINEKLDKIMKVLEIR